MISASRAAPSWVEDPPPWVSDVTDWFIGIPLRVTMILVVAVVVRFVAHRAINRSIHAMLNANVRERPEAEGRLATAMAATRLRAIQLRDERRRQRATTIGSILRSIVSAIIVGIAFVMVLSEFSIDLAPIVASAGVAGVALGFGAQSLVKDFLSGVFMVLEDQYGVGDYIDTGSGTGTVEEVGLRVTRVRDFTGVLWYVRNGEILRIGNHSQGWSLADVTIPISYDADLDQVRRIVEEVGKDMLADPAMSELLLEAPSVGGLEDVAGEAVMLRVWGKCAPMKSWAVQRALRERLKAALDEAGLHVPVLIKPFLASPSDQA